MDYDGNAFKNNELEHTNFISTHFIDIPVLIIFNVAECSTIIHFVWASFR